MRLKLMTFAVVGLVAIGWWYVSNKPKQQVTESVSSSTATQTSALPEPRKNITAEHHKEPAFKTIENIDTLDEPIIDDDLVTEWMAQLSVRRYSEDVAVELTSLGLEFESCGNTDLSWRFKDKTLSAKQTAIRTAVEQHCKDLLTAYPLLVEDHVKDGLRMVYESYPVETPLGQFFKQQTQPAYRMEISTFLSQLVPLALQAQNSQVLVMADWMSGRLPYEAELEQTLQSVNRPYIQTIRSLALTSLSCQFQNGITCTPSSRFMQDKCFNDERFCGMDFKQWFEVALTPGIQGDVNLVKQYFEGLAQP